MKRELIVILFLILCFLGIIITVNLNSETEPTEQSIADYELRESSEYWMNRGSICKDFDIHNGYSQRKATLCFSEFGIIEYGTLDLSDSMYIEQVLPVRRDLISHGLKTGVVKQIDWWESGTIHK